ncbi:PDDEXK nuclease domain-containing protein [Glutamicibacter sp. MNS18]|uniref:PDDEXK nuclease domain-containing protein n=1 Tax=Glutamicibacter sp. MNS18 TaxID=2989817 RepID=UPI0022363035|nr:PDDEXK nuclease domain-containing protein [Glutamicibacter sp. MNS18]MCW4465646.1 PDDEXK nuclease domain-containing protein [Glutamicibacter sp. MNS18]
MASESKTSDSDDVTRFASTPPATGLPLWYPTLLDSVSERISQDQQRASLAANQELVSTYWHIGHDILARQSEQGWGTKVIDRLSADLRDRYPGIKGFSPRNLKYMRSFAEVWPSDSIVQEPPAQLPWYHQIALLEKLDDESTRIWYAHHAVAEGWSRNHLVRQIETRLHERSGQATSSFQATLPPLTSSIAQEALKDPYVFDFLTMSEKRSERELEGQLLQHVERFLLELGRGFAFVGRQIRLDVAGDEFFPDMIFYNFVLRRFVVIELKATKFEPGYLGQLGMYMSAVDDLLAQPGDEPTIGLLLCKTKNSVVAEYALRGFKSPIGVAEWATELKEALPEEVSSSLPTIDELEAELAGSGIDEEAGRET